MPSNPPGKDTSTFSINLRSELLETLNEVAETMGKSRNKLIAELLELSLAGDTIDGAMEQEAKQVRQLTARYRDKNTTP